MDPTSRSLAEISGGLVEDDLVTSAFSAVPTGYAEEGERKSFQPWHLPRKHYCRLKQWSFHTQKLLTELKISTPARERPLHYLTPLISLVLYEANELERK